MCYFRFAAKVPHSTLGRLLHLSIYVPVCDIDEARDPGFAPACRSRRLAIFCGNACTLRAQDQGPLAPPPKFEVNRIPVCSAPGPPPIPVEEIIRNLPRTKT